MSDMPKLTIKQRHSDSKRYGPMILLNDIEVPCCKSVQFTVDAGELPVVKLTCFVDEIDIETEAITELEAIALLKYLKGKSISGK